MTRDEFKNAYNLEQLVAILQQEVYYNVGYYKYQPLEIEYNDALCAIFARTLDCSHSTILLDNGDDFASIATLKNFVFMLQQFIT